MADSKHAIRNQILARQINLDCNFDYNPAKDKIYRKKLEFLRTNKSFRPHVLPRFERMFMF